MKLLTATKVDRLATAAAKPYTEWFDRGALAQLSGLTTPYTPWTTSAARPSALQQLALDITLNERTSYLELGAGVSTLVVARLIRRAGIPVVATSIESDERWAGFITELLRRENLHDTIQIRVAPLSNEQTPWGPVPFYQLQRIPDLRSTYDIVFVDGPPAYRPDIRYARWPSLPMLEHLLDEDSFAFFLDDINRMGEADIFRSWRAMYSDRGWHFSSRPLRTGLGAVHLRNSWNQD